MKIDPRGSLSFLARGQFGGEGIGARHRITCATNHCPVTGWAQQGSATSRPDLIAEELLLHQYTHAVFIQHRIIRGMQFRIPTSNSLLHPTEPLWPVNVVISGHSPATGTYEVEPILSRSPLLTRDAVGLSRSPLRTLILAIHTLSTVLTLTPWLKTKEIRTR